MKKLYSFLPALVFLLFLGIMALVLFFSPVRDYSENEKRYLAGRPEVSASAILEGKTQEELEKFTADQIPGRDFFVGVNAYWNLSTGRNAAQDIYHCDQGYLINAPKAGSETIFTDNIARFEAFTNKLGLPADLLMVPTTGYLMDNVLPAFHEPYEDDKLYELAGGLVQNTRLLDVRETLKAGKNGGQVCYRTDHHLTSYGNYLLYQAYQTATGGSFLPRESYQVSSYDGFYGTAWSGSGYWLTKPDSVEVWDSGLRPTVSLIDGGAAPQVSNELFYLSHLEEMDKYPIFLDGNHGLVTIHNPEAQGGSLLILRDSYAHCLGPFLANEYQNIYLVDLRYYRESVSQFVAEHPVDRVLYLYGMDSLITDTNSVWLQ
ncbi:MAG: DHHW family protein [Clostridiales bacterium]|nr:DHHW family protein [Clostridiales bacterium]